MCAKCVATPDAPLLVVDVGNTSTSLAMWDGTRIGTIIPVRGGIREEAATRAALDKLDAHRACGAMLASVVPAVDAAWVALLRDEYGVTMDVLSATDTPLPIGVDYPHRAQIGADRLCDAVGAVERHGSPVAIADFGTALTMDVVDARGAYIGGFIAPGLPLMTGYLHEKTAKLPAVELGGELPAWGDSTEHAMQLGAWHGHRGMVRELVAAARERVGANAPLCATGGYAAWAMRGFDGVYIEPDLTLFGLARIWEYAHK